MLAELVMMAIYFTLLLFWVLLGSVLLWFISHIFVMIYKTLFCDVQVKLYKVWKKRLKHYTNDEELEKALDELKTKKVD